MRIQRTSQIITAAIIVLSVVAIACAFVSRHYRIIEARAYETRRKMFHLTEQLAYGSDRLTAAVRAYAATGDRRHYDAFQKELRVDRNRDLAVDGLQELGLDAAELELVAHGYLASGCDLHPLRAVQIPGNDFSRGETCATGCPQQQQ